MFAIVRVDCDPSYNGFDSKLQSATLLPIGISAVILVIQAVVTKVVGGQLLRSTGVKAVLMILFFILPVTSNVICQAFSCSTFDEDTDSPIHVMTVDASIDCGGSRHQFIVAYALLSGLVYVIGVPVCIGMLLRSRRDDIAARTSLTGGPELSTLSFLFRNFDPELGSWMPVLDLYRRLALSSLLLLFKGDFFLLASCH